MMQRRLSRLLGLLSFVLPATFGSLACNTPRDPARTTERITGSVMRVGAVDNPPWVVVRNAEDVVGVEPTLAQDVARQSNAKIEWVHGSESVLLDKLRHKEVDLVLGGLRDDSPWKDQVALTRSYFTSRESNESRSEAKNVKHVLAVPPGENAWLMRVEQVLAEHQNDVPQLVEDAQRGGG
jgi:polar amino acid transport system substrate-binding protein